MSQDTASNPSERLSSTTTLTVFVEDGDDQDPAFVHEGCTVVHGACADVEYSAEVTSGLIAEEDTESRRFATARLTIGVRVVDSNPPILLASATEGFVDENSPIGTYVVTQPGGDEPLYFMVSDDDI
ncbi:hypothetical protein V5799_013147, partial [Amblyomma americanum]